MNDEEKALRQRIFDEIRPIISGDSSLVGTETRGLIYDMVTAKYGTEDVTCRTGTRPGPCLTTEGERVYNLITVLLKKVTDRVAYSLLRGPQ